MDIGGLLGLWFQSLFVGLTMNILSICIMLVVYGRLIEIYLVTSLGPIPLATIGNSEWRGMGQGYLKSLFALGFQAFLTLRGKRLVIAGELEEHQRLSTSTLKQLASTDKLTIEEKFKQPETVKQSHTLVLFTNFLPRVGSMDNGTWRRLLVIPFNAVISEQDSAQNYAEMLVEKAGGAILSWAIQGAVDFIKNGFKLVVPDVVAMATEEYQNRENWLENFIDERCIKEPNARVGARALYDEYKRWAQDAGEYVRREADFSTAMEAAGYLTISGELLEGIQEAQTPTPAPGQ